MSSSSASVVSQLTSEQASELLQSCAPDHKLAPYCEAPLNSFSLHVWERCLQRCDSHHELTSALKEFFPTQLRVELEISFNGSPQESLLPRRKSQVLNELCRCILRRASASATHRRSDLVIPWDIYYSIDTDPELRVLLRELRIPPSLIHDTVEPDIMDLNFRDYRARGEPISENEIEKLLREKLPKRSFEPQIFSALHGIFFSLSWQARSLSNEDYIRVIEGIPYTPSPKPRQVNTLRSDLEFRILSLLAESANRELAPDSRLDFLYLLHFILKNQGLEEVRRFLVPEEEVMLQTPRSRCSSRPNSQFRPVSPDPGPILLENTPPQSSRRLSMSTLEEFNRSSVSDSSSSN